MTIKRKILLCAGLLLASGCSPLAPLPDHSDFFILTPIASPADMTPIATSTTAASNVSIGVGPVDFPDYLRRLEIVTLTAPNQLDISNHRRWGEPLDKNFVRALTENLSQLLGTRKIEKYPWPRKTQIDYQVTIDVVKFETTKQGQSQLSARWIIKDGATGKDLYASETNTTGQVPPGDIGTSVALSTALAKLSGDIASHIADLSQHRTSISGKSATEQPY